MPDAFFWEIHSGLDREGPGDEASTRCAFSLLKDLPARPAILDVGCGPVAQTFQLLEMCDGAVTAVDTHQDFLDRLRARGESLGLAGRIKTLNASMQALPFPDACFDLLWSEGAMYMMGFREGLTQRKRLLKPHGYLAVTEPCWLEPYEEIPPKAIALWANDYPGMTSVAHARSAVRASGYREIDHFVLPTPHGGITTDQRKPGSRCSGKNIATSRPSSFVSPMRTKKSPRIALIRPIMATSSSC